jgi:hypothetical protein
MCAAIRWTCVFVVAFAFAMSALLSSLAFCNYALGAPLPTAADIETCVLRVTTVALSLSSVAERFPEPRSLGLASALVAPHILAPIAAEWVGNSFLSLCGLWAFCVVGLDVGPRWLRAALRQI